LRAEDGLLDGGSGFDHVELRHRKGEPDKRNPRVVIEIEEVATGERQTAP